MGVAHSPRPPPSLASGTSIDATPTTVPLRQVSLPWPGTEEPCPKCHGRRHVYYLHAGQPSVEVVGGKRVACPVCAGTGTVRTPLRNAADLVG